MKTYLLTLLAIGYMAMMSACKDFLNIAPPENQLTAATVFLDAATANAAVNGIYSRMMGNSGFISGESNLSTLCGFSADELTNYSTGKENIQFFTNSLDPTATADYLWNVAYQYIYSANAVIEGLSASDKIGPGIKNQLLGEALFIRSFCYFYLVNLFGDVPYHQTTDYKNNNVRSRTPTKIIYEHLVEDLKRAKSLLKVDYSFSNQQRIRPNKFTAGALLARVYLYTGNWSAAETESTEIIEHTALYDLASVTLEDAFLKNNKESIWQLMPVKPGFNTDIGRYLILSSVPVFAALQDELYDSFEAGDPRKTSWIGSIAVEGQTYHYPFKYKVVSANDVTEYYTVFRLGEQYLIRAEARAQQYNIAGAVADLNMIRQRARGTSTNSLLDLSSSLSQNDCLDKIDRERRSELFMEWGHRWMDLKRRNQADVILSVSKGNSWDSTDVLYPIPHTEMLNNPNIVQNEGYH